MLESTKECIVEISQLGAELSQENRCILLVAELQDEVSKALWGSITLWE